MKFAATFCLLLIASTLSLHAQVPTPRSTVAINNTPLSWTKQGNSDFVLYNENGKALNNVQDLYYLETDTLAVLDKSYRKVYLLNDFKDAPSGANGSVTLLAENIKQNFYITNPYSFAYLVDDEYISGKYTNIKGSYVYYLEDKDVTYCLRDIRKYKNWGARSSELLDYSPDNTYWYRDAANGEFGVIKEGKALDYSRVSIEKNGDDLIVTWDGVKTYVLPGYYTVASFVFKPVSLYSASGTSNPATASATGCVRGNCKDGWGKYDYGEAGHYDGFWQNGLRNGYGLYKWKDGSKYIGNWLNDSMDDYGVYLAANGDNIIGQYRDGQLNGLGTTITNDEYAQGIFSDGDLVTTYSLYTNNVNTGCTAGDCMNKFGQYKFENGDVFKGFFKNGNLHMGTYKFASGGKYSGMFNSQGQFHGMGRYFFADDAYYGGQWRNGKYHGRGYYHDSDLKQQIGEWSNGVLVKTLK